MMVLSSATRKTTRKIASIRRTNFRLGLSVFGSFWVATWFDASLLSRFSTSSVVEGSEAASCSMGEIALVAGGEGEEDMAICECSSAVCESFIRRSKFRLTISQTCQEYLLEFARRTSACNHIAASARILGGSCSGVLGGLCSIVRFAPGDYRHRCLYDLGPAKLNGPVSTMTSGGPHLAGKQ